MKHKKYPEHCKCGYKSDILKNGKVRRIHPEGDGNIIEHLPEDVKGVPEYEKDN